MSGAASTDDPYYGFLKLYLVCPKANFWLRSCFEADFRRKTDTYSHVDKDRLRALESPVTYAACRRIFWLANLIRYDSDGYTLSRLYKKTSFTEDDTNHYFSHKRIERFPLPLLEWFCAIEFNKREDSQIKLGDVRYSYQEKIVIEKIPRQTLANTLSLFTGAGYAEIIKPALYKDSASDILFKKHFYYHLDGWLTRS